jgi:hypothetical protein
MEALRSNRVLALPIASAAAALLLLGASSDAAAATTNYPVSLFELTVQSPAGVSEFIVFDGPTAIQDSLNATGAAADTDGNGLDQATTQITGLTLTGTSTTLGLGLGTMHLVPAPSLGEVEETVNNLPGILDLRPYAASGSANSFFDVFFQLDFSSTTLHNSVAEHVAGPARRQRELDRVPRHERRLPSGRSTGAFNAPAPWLRSGGSRRSRADEDHRGRVTRSPSRSSA